MRVRALPGDGALRLGAEELDGWHLVFGRAAAEDFLR
jgi:hypothetical protein